MELIATKRAFYNNALIERGARFEFHGSPTKVPSWAQPADKPLPPEPKPLADTKPRAAQVAVSRKAKGSQADME